LKEIGEWMKLNGEAIYNTRPIEPYKENNICFTQSKDGKTIYLHYLLKENESIPPVISFKGPAFNNKPIITLLTTNKKLNWKKENGLTKISLPKDVLAKHAVVVKIVLQ